MSHQFKPGDLVLITAEDNFGRCAEIVSRHEGPCRVWFGTSFQDIPAGCVGWVVTAERLVSTFSISGLTDFVDEIAYSERWLKPLRGDFAPEQQKAKEVAA
ncbi:hypothetical protein [Pseudomonas sp. RGM 3321]|uniref:hypothetical protein n=1 Tax=Pseudomonas sp. RGM 3321 TaxID=2930089 RepID=UPI001FCC7D8E|nr:hypothetical protein [Pseudomonas sp. RGM 3321]MCJ2375163.1 hypothetical protein [Pseudomonas sp. RGM 3321]